MENSQTQSQSEVQLPSGPHLYPRLLSSLQEQSPEQQVAILRWMAQNDLFFLLTRVLGRMDANRQWIFERCREVQASPNGNLDLWARFHYKSTIITFALTIQDILRDPEVTVGIFSHTRPIAKAFLRQIKREFEQNTLLQSLFPDVLYERPDIQSPQWTEDGGIIVRRSSNPKEATLEAHGLVDGAPVSRHFSTLVYDDVVTKDSVTNPEQIKKTTEALELSYALGTETSVRRMVGTRYHANDTYATVLARGTMRSRCYPATKDGTDAGEPVLISGETLAKYRRDMGPYTFAAQMLQNPTADKSSGFKREWLRFFDQSDGGGMNRYIVVDPANEKKRSSDHTAMWVIGLGGDSNYTILDFVYDKLSLKERADWLLKLHREWKPLRVGYEKYGKDSDIDHMRYVQDQVNYRFEITELGGRLSKNDRIRRLVPLFEQGRIYLPRAIYYTQHDGRQVNLIEEFLIHEYDAFPVARHDDALDALSRICDEDMFIVAPMATEPVPERYGRRRAPKSAWAS